MSALPQKLKELRAEKHLSQRKIAKRLNILQVTYCNWENSKSEPSLDALITLCNFFEISADYLLGLENEDGTKTYRQDANIVAAPTPPPVPRPHAVPYAARSGAIGVAHLTDEQARKLDEILGLDPEEPDETDDPKNKP